MSKPLRGLLGPITSLLLLGGCAPTAELADLGPLEPVATHADIGRAIGLDAQPSARAAALLPDGARYRLVLDEPEGLALLVISGDGRIAGRVRILAHDRHYEVVLDDFDGPPVRVEAWTTNDGLHGRTSVGQHHAAWRVRVDADGSIAGERWSKRVSTQADAGNLLLAQAITRDIGRIVVAHEDALSERTLDLAAFAELSLELSVRAWQGRARARLPSLASLVAP